ncbi:MAG TPA: Rieske 2Fe-2S domain-containing protein [Candidatus Binataceae bacterium]|nr:Rieske 2Fe-2S domain-containing protein [Candidatus Binataceae bacterium]
MGLSREANDQLTQTGRGTLLGDLMRRYWIPALLSEELAEPDCPPVRLKLLGERLIGFRDSQGRLGILDELCAHRRASLWFGRNEQCGLRCAYHGWKFDVEGHCVDLPSEPEESGMRRRIRLKSYPVLERGGVIWAYLGPPEQRPEPPALEWALVAPERRFVSKRLQECNYLQAMEGGIDSSHVSFLHSGALNSDPLFAGSKGNQYNLGDRMPHFEVTEFDGGLLIGARRRAEGGKFYWRITPWIMPFYTLVAPRADHPINGHAWVPIDDHHCWAWSISYHPHRALSAAEVAAMKDGQGIHARYVPGTFVPRANQGNDYLMDREAQRAGLSFSGVEGIAMQDASLQESMGPIVDRAEENLVSTDNGIIMARRKLLAAARANRLGQPIPGLSAASQRVRSCAIELPDEVDFKHGAEHGLFGDIGSAPVSV